MGIMNKKYTDLTVGETLGLAFGAGFTVLTIECIALKGITECVEDVKTAAIAVRDESKVCLEKCNESMNQLKAKLKKS